MKGLLPVIVKQQQRTTTGCSVLRVHAEPGQGPVETTTKNYNLFWCSDGVPYLCHETTTKNYNQMTAKELAALITRVRAGNNNKELQQPLMAVIAQPFWAIGGRNNNKELQLLTLSIVLLLSLYSETTTKNYNKLAPELLSYGVKNMSM